MFDFKFSLNKVRHWAQPCSSKKMLLCWKLGLKYTLRSCSMTWEVCAGRKCGSTKYGCKRWAYCWQWNWKARVVRYSWLRNITLKLYFQYLELKIILDWEWHAGARVGWPVFTLGAVMDMDLCLQRMLIVSCGSDNYVRLWSYVRLTCEKSWRWAYSSTYSNSIVN